MAASWASSNHARRTMKANKRRDTKPELRIRSALHRSGLRYRVDTAPLKSVRHRADIVLTRVHVAVFIDGCFWHGCPEHFIPPKTNAEYCRQKIQRNRDRDKETDRILADAGWTVLRFWEHEHPRDAVNVIINTWRTQVRNF